MSESDKRFYTEQEILAAIDSAQHLAKKHMLNAETYEKVYQTQKAEVVHDYAHN